MDTQCQVAILQKASRAVLLRHRTAPDGNGTMWIEICLSFCTHMYGVIVTADRGTSRLINTLIPECTSLLLRSWFAIHN